MLLELGVLGGEDRLPQLRRDRLVGDDLAPLDGELADDLAARAVDARDRARRVVVERGDLRQVAGVGEEHAARDAEDRGEHEEDDDPGAAGETLTTYLAISRVPAHAGSCAARTGVCATAAADATEPLAARDDGAGCASGPIAAANAIAAARRRRPDGAGATADAAWRPPMAPRRLARDAAAIAGLPSARLPSARGAVATRPRGRCCSGRPPRRRWPTRSLPTPDARTARDGAPGAWRSAVRRSWRGASADRGASDARGPRADAVDGRAGHGVGTRSARRRSATAMATRGRRRARRARMIGAAGGAARRASRGRRPSRRGAAVAAGCADVAPSVRGRRHRRVGAGERTARIARLPRRRADTPAAVQRSRVDRAAAERRGAASVARRRGAPRRAAGAPRDCGWPRCRRGRRGRAADRANRRADARGTAYPRHSGAASRTTNAPRVRTSIRWRVDDVDVDVAAAEAAVRHHRPRVPRIVVAGRSRDARRIRTTGAVVPAERAPADVAGRVGPGHPRRTPRAAGNPEPRAGREAPAAVVMRRPCPRVGADPGPAVRPERRPAAVVVRPPADATRGYQT